MLKSALVITHDALFTEQRVVKELKACLASAHRLARAHRCKVSLTLQHNIRNDCLAVMVDCERRTFGQYGLTAAEAFHKTRREIEKYLKDNFDEELRPKAKQAAGASRGTRRGRAGATRKRVAADRKG